MERTGDGQIVQPMTKDNDNMILSLYDTFLARFSFFRKHIRIVAALEARVEQLEEWSAHQAEQFRLLESKYLEVLDRCDELEKAPTSNEPKETSRGLIKNSQDIMESIYSNYYVTGEAVPDR